MEKKSVKSGSACYVCYQPKGDPFTHMRNFATIEDGLEFSEVVERFHLEFDIPVYITVWSYKDQKFIKKIDNRGD